jgi:hypothetical protein
VRLGLLQPEASPRKYEPVMATMCTSSRAMNAPRCCPSLEFVYGDQPAVEPFNTEFLYGEAEHGVCTDETLAPEQMCSEDPASDFIKSANYTFGGVRF